MIPQPFKSLCFVAVVTWLLLPMVPCVAQVSEEEHSSQREARCLMNVSWSSGSVPLNEEVLYSMARSSEVLSAAFSRSRGADPVAALVEGNLSIEMDVLHRGEPFESTMVVEMEVSLDDSFAPSTSARQAMLAICDQLNEAIQQFHEASLSHSKRRHDRLMAYHGEAEVHLEELQALRRQLLEESGRADLTSQVITEELTDLVRNQRHLDMELHTQRIRQAMLEQRVSKISEDLEAKAASDAILQELTKVVELHEQDVALKQERVAQKQLRAFAEEVTEAQERLAYARVELFQARKEVVRQVGGDALTAYNEELVQVSMSAAQVEAQIEFIQQRTKEIQAKRLLELADRFDKEVAIQLPIAEGNLAEACEELEEVSKHLRMLTPPRLVVIGRKEGTSKE